MPIQAAASRYKRAYHPPVNYKNAAPRSEARTKPSGTPYAYQQLKKFNDLHALKNPDWRNRPSDNSSSAVDDSEHDVAEAAGAGKQRVGMDASPPTPAFAVQSKRETELHQTISSSKEGATASSTLRYSQNDIFAISSGMEPKILRAMEEEKPIQYQVLKQLPLSSSREHPLQLFEVAPLGRISGNSTKPIVDIRPLRGNLELRKQGVSSNSQDEQLTAALRAADTTPLKVRAQVHQARGPHAASNEPRARQGFSETHEIYASQSTKAQAQINERQQYKSDALPNDTDRDEAFQRFLEKLRQNNKPQGKKSQKRHRTDSGYEDSSKGSPRENPIETASHSRRAQGPSPPKKTASEHLRSSHVLRTENHNQKEVGSSSAASGAFSNEPAKFQNFNPKAREFLSFAVRRDASSGSRFEEEDLEPFRPFSTPFADRGDRRNVTSVTELTSLGDIASAQPPPPFGTVPFAAANGATDHLTLNNSMATRMISVPVDHFGGSLQGPAISLQQLSLVNPAMLQPQPVLQPLSGNILGYTAPQLVNASFPLANGSVNPYLNMPCGQLPLVGGPPHPPQSLPLPLPLPLPVPKPRRPDPRDQQAYEAWIEWRKANQPGYAHECRMRQQRRAQRSTDNRAPGRVAVGHRN
ncbi:hypothetical protein TGAMA5MH_04117 [Trichoderma gamsii]|uniref:Uncharacterized protein n=1 Tax=Trichoderma gamsii TaxID=398673 RepID=A0A2K0TE78_9HYPO|nr:hypothetical protein TGAMA5MH_04117 [Trichoderma gamsii]